MDGGQIVVSEARVKESLEAGLVPVVKQSIAGLNLMREAVVSDGGAAANGGRNKA